MVGSLVGNGFLNKYYFEIRSHIVRASLELAVWLCMTLDFRSSAHCLPSTAVKGVCYPHLGSLPFFLVSFQPLFLLSVSHYGQGSQEGKIELER